MQTYKLLYESKKRIAAKCEFLAEAVQSFIIAFTKIAQMNCPYEIAAGNVKKMNALLAAMNYVKTKADDIMKERRYQADSDRVLSDKYEKLEKERQVYQKKAYGRKKYEAETQVKYLDQYLTILETDIKKAYAEMQTLESQTNQLVDQFYNSFKPLNGDVSNVFAIKANAAAWSGTGPATKSQKAANDLLDFGAVSTTSTASQQQFYYLVESSVQGSQLTYEQQLQLEWERYQAYSQLQPQVEAQVELPAQYQTFAPYYQGYEQYDPYNYNYEVPQVQPSQYDPFSDKW